MHKPLVGLAIFLFAAAASADGLPKGTSVSKPASKGTTEVTTGGFEAAKPAEEEKNATEAAVSAGAIQSSGNSRSFAATANANLRIRREDNQFTAVVAANYARAKLPDQPATETTVENEQGRLRYDRFVSKDLVLFLGLQALHDRFRGLDLRAQVDPGVGYYFINEAKHLFWVEGGYDFLYDIRRDEDRIAIENGQPVLLAKTSSVHSGRAFLGYAYAASDSVGFNATVEYLQALTDSTIYRINADLGVSSKLGKRFSLAVTYSLKYDHAPLPGKEKLDNVTSVALVYSLF